jgi:hypothetical protein
VKCKNRPNSISHAKALAIIYNFPEDGLKDQYESCFASENGKMNPETTW